MGSYYGSSVAHSCFSVQLSEWYLITCCHFSPTPQTLQTPSNLSAGLLHWVLKTHFDFNFTPPHLNLFWSSPFPLAAASTRRPCIIFFSKKLSWWLFFYPCPTNDISIRFFALLDHETSLPSMTWTHFFRMNVWGRYFSDSKIKGSIKSSLKRRQETQSFNHSITQSLNHSTSNSHTQKQRKKEKRKEKR